MVQVSFLPFFLYRFFVLFLLSSLLWLRRRRRRRKRREKKRTRSWFGRVTVSDERVAQKRCVLSWGPFVLGFTRPSISFFILFTFVFSSFSFRFLYPISSDVALGLYLVSRGKETTTLYQYVSTRFTSNRGDHQRTAPLNLTTWVKKKNKHFPHFLLYLNP